MKLTIIGASGHGKVVADIAKKCGYDTLVFLDDDEEKNNCGGWPVIGRTETSVKGDIFVAIGNSKMRKEITSRITEGRLISLIHPSAVISDDVQIGIGTVVMPGVVINPGTIIGDGCIINTSSSVDHDCVIGNYCHISVGSHLCGNVKVGAMTWIGAGSSIINNVNICENCMIGAGAVVVKDITSGGTYTGVPARKMRTKK